MVVTLYMFPLSPPCRAVLMTARHIGVDVQIREEYDFFRKSAGAALLKINRRGCVPTIDDGGFHLWESRAIMTYLVNKFEPNSPLYPKEPQKRALVDMMLSFDQGTLYKSQVEYLYPQVYYGFNSTENAEKNYRNSLAILEDALTKNPYVAGKQVTLADLSISASIVLAEIYDFDFRLYPNIRFWLNTLKEKLHYFKEVNYIPLLQYKLYYKYNFGFEDDENDFFAEKITSQEETHL